ncbi:uncharacterized, partial [Tachysurus ichikawai]
LIHPVHQRALFNADPDSVHGSDAFLLQHLRRDQSSASTLVLIRCGDGE